MIGRAAADFIEAEDMPVLAAAIVRIHSPGVQDESATVRMRKKDGSKAWMEMNARLVRDSITKEPKEYITVMRDVTERKKLEERLAELALTDGLTGLANRRAFDEALEREWRRTLREGSQISLILLDIDLFKGFNDRYGHQVGDDCLRAIAIALRKTMRATDIVARYGGEEMAIILPATDTAGALEAAEKALRAVDALRIPHQGNAAGGGWVTVSAGAASAVARQGGTMKMPESLLLAADHALYKAKNGGRDRVATALLVASKEG